MVYRFSALNNTLKEGVFVAGVAFVVTVQVLLCFLVIKFEVSLGLPVCDCFCEFENYCEQGDWLGFK